MLVEIFLLFLVILLTGLDFIAGFWDLIPRILRSKHGVYKLVALFVFTTTLYVVVVALLP